MTPQGLRQFIRSRLDEINSDGEHVKCKGHKWQFDDVAIDRLDEMRNYSESTSEQISRVVRKTGGTLQEENKRLLMALLAAQNKIIELQNEILRLKAPETEKQSFVSKIIKKLFGK